jgi:anti-sigma B factor antagonist
MAGQRSSGGLAVTVQALSAKAAVMLLRGRLDAVTAATLRARVGESVRQGRAEIVCDLSGVTSLDSSGLVGLVGAVRATASRAGFFKLASASAEVGRLFGLSGLDRVLELHPSVETLVAGSVAVPEARLAA